MQIGTHWHQLWTHELASIFSPLSAVGARWKNQFSNCSLPLVSLSIGQSAHDCFKCLRQQPRQLRVIGWNFINWNVKANSAAPGGAERAQLNLPPRRHVNVINDIPRRMEEKSCEIPAKFTEHEFDGNCIAQSVSQESPKKCLNFFQLQSVATCTAIEIGGTNEHKSLQAVEWPKRQPDDCLISFDFIAWDGLGREGIVTKSC